MANNQFDQTIFNVRERPLSSDWNQAQSQLHRTIRAVEYCESLRRTGSGGNAPVSVVNQGFVGDGFKVYAFAGMVVLVQGGLGFAMDLTDVPASIDGIIGLSDLSPYKPMLLGVPASFTVPAAPGPGLSRVDIIEAKPYRRTENPNSRDILDPTSGAFVPALVNKTMAWTHDGETGYVVSPAASTAALSYKQGVAGAPGAVPATTAGYTRVAVIYVPTGTVAITEANIRDTRKLVTENGCITVGVKFDYKTGAGVPPANVEAIAPPGIRMAVMHTGAADISWWIILEGARAASLTTSQHQIAATAPMHVGTYSVENAHQIIVADSANLLDPLLTLPVLSVLGSADATIAQQCVLANVSLLEWDIVTQLWQDLASDVDDVCLHMTILL